MADPRGIEQVLSQAAEAGDVPGVVGMSASDKGTIYQGAFGKRDLSKDYAMTLGTVGWFASMTKAVTAAAAMQLVEQGKLGLDRPASDYVPSPTLSSPRVLEGFDPSGKAKLRPARRPITVRHLLTHTAGFSNDIWNPVLGKYMADNGVPGIITCQNAALDLPLMFDPGDRWEYGINIDWVGKIVEALSGQRLGDYFQKNIFSPLGMKDTSFQLTPAQRARLARVHQRGEDGTLAPIDFELPQEPESRWVAAASTRPCPITCASPGCCSAAAPRSPVRYGRAEQVSSVGEHGQPGRRNSCRRPVCRPTSRAGRSGARSKSASSPCSGT